jgi:hypothetical protein
MAGSGSMRRGIRDDVAIRRARPDAQLEWRGATRQAMDRPEPRDGMELENLDRAGSASGADQARGRTDIAALNCRDRPRGMLRDSHAAAWWCLARRTICPTW